jgi:hypothetical protein
MGHEIHDRSKSKPTDMTMLDLRIAADRIQRERVARKVASVDRKSTIEDPLVAGIVATIVSLIFIFVVFLVCHAFGVK